MKTLLALSIPMLGFSAFAIGGNARFWLKKTLSKDHSATIPLVGGLIGALGMLLLPYDGARFFWWVPLLVDVNCFPLLIAIAIAYALRKRY